MQTQTPPLPILQEDGPAPRFPSGEQVHVTHVLFDVVVLVAIEIVGTLLLGLGGLYLWAPGIINLLIAALVASVAGYTLIAQALRQPYPVRMKRLTLDIGIVSVLFFVGCLLLRFPLRETSLTVLVNAIAGPIGLLLFWRIAPLRPTASSESEL